ncbi:DUF5677 domain-containing protein [Mesorhizobium sp. M0488]|uniref:DUF5677 domain-containing protein n=1 Tax=unclassified Mesorhizobium TaxID=325217 RepID=UPI00333C0A02
MSVDTEVPLRISVSNCLALLAPNITAIKDYRWTGSDQDQFWEFFKRSMLVRQFEAAQAVVDWGETGHAHFGVTLLRPAYEEMLWATYLEKHSDKAPKIALLLSSRETSETLEAQNQFIGAKAMQQHGFTQKYLKQRDALTRPQLAELRAIGKQLGWRNDEPPGAAFLARQVGKEREYNFVYQATSRFVHFSGHELGRRVWGRRGSVKIGSDQFAAFWSDFALYWSFRILIETANVLREVFSDYEIDVGSMRDGMMENIGKMYPIPIITKAELESW